ncbi:hypothetical protein SB861_36575 [Paraburkholderia sp. SIMBA_049]
MTIFDPSVRHAAEDSYTINNKELEIGISAMGIATGPQRAL